ncbi:MAG: IS110 family transposase [Deltaproteobacteria bacterium]|nr:IS110 family transposase [Deltaproteobacteria bacterium]
MCAKIGRASTAVLLVYVGLPRNFSSSGAYLKMMGLNLSLREYSSGTKQSGLHITLQNAATENPECILISDEVFKAYFEKHAPVTTSGRRKGSVSTIIAMMRKLVRGLWHCANYDVASNSDQLFDTRSLKLNTSSSLDDVEEIENAEIELIAVEA